MAKDSKGHGSDGKVRGFVAPDYPAGGGGTKGHVAVTFKGRDFFHTGKTGKRMDSGEKAYEYSHKDRAKGEEHRVWVTKSGKIHRD